MTNIKRYKGRYVECIYGLDYGAIYRISSEPYRMGHSPCGQLVIDLENVVTKQPEGTVPFENIGWYYKLHTKKWGDERV